ncbi:helix-turn-helix domain-containing protein [Bacillota bacterium HCP28S3_F12]|nr:helix-turn-helix transcriptional regulator [Bacillota bacterium]
MERNYKKLWIMLIERDMTKTDLRKAAGISTNALAKLGRNESVPLETLEKICKALNCRIEDILDYEEPMN